MKINFVRESLEFSRRGVLTGIISLELGPDKYFPEKQWNDNIVLILESWKNELDVMKINSNYKGRFVFFDGPFYFTLSKASNLYRVDFFENRKSTSSCFVDINVFFKEVLCIGNELLLLAKERQWESIELDKLRPIFLRHRGDI
ncbi:MULTISPECIES: hypothetical protein [Sphingobacterium]|uniref:hypothetical protein n=1 Tax=Sphingobacterium TaxID=28453 RepID=UPI002580BA6E|nr:MULTISPECIES: hypothetical protein [Sphingobacterium]